MTSYKIYSNNKGIALLITLALISVIMAAVLELIRASNDLAELDKKRADRLQAYQMAESGIELGRFILTCDAEQNDIDSLQDIWADSQLLASAVELLGFENGNLNIVISDELGKIQINALLTHFPGNALNEDQRALWERLLNLMISSDRSIDIRDPAEIINSLKDWLDSGDDDAVSGLSGAESDYYESLNPPVVCSNAPLNSVGELFTIKGINEDLISAKQFLSKEIESNYAGTDKIETDHIHTEDKDKKQILDPSQIFTVYGLDSNKKDGGKFVYSGTININTADMIVLAAVLPEGLEDQASELADFRVEKEENKEIFVNNLESGWYKKVIGLSPKESKNFERIIRYSSDIFKIYAKAEFNGEAISLTGFVKRVKRAETGKWSCDVLQLIENQQEIK